MTPARQTVITGCGAVTPLGNNIATMWQRLCAGTSALQSAADKTGSFVAGRVDADDLRQRLEDPRPLRLMDRATMFGAIATVAAVDDASIDLKGVEAGRAGVFVGAPGRSYDIHDLEPAMRESCTNGALDLKRFGHTGMDLIAPMWLLKGLGNGGLFFATTRYQLRGDNGNFDAGGISGTVAIAEAALAIERGYLDVALAGAYDSLLTNDRIEVFRASGMLGRSSDTECGHWSYDHQRNGFALSEGSAFVVLEERQHALRRGATIYATVLGGASTAAPRDRRGLGPSAEGFATTMDVALALAGTGDIDGIYGFGLATPFEDDEEICGLRRCLGPRLARIPITSSKSLIGNTGAASGAIDTIAAVMSLRDQRMPPTRQPSSPHPIHDLDVVGGRARPLPLKTIALVNANLAGVHATLMLQRHD